MDPRGTQPHPRRVPRRLRRRQPVSSCESVPRLPLEPLRAALRRNGEGSRVLGRPGRHVDATRVSPGPSAAPGPRRPVLHGPDLAVRVRREHPPRALSEPAGWDPRLVARSHGTPRRIQLPRLEAEAGRRPAPQRRAPRPPRPRGPQTLRRGPAPDAPPGLTGRGARPSRYRPTYHAIVSRRRSPHGFALHPSSFRAFDASTARSIAARSRAARGRRRG